LSQLYHNNRRRIRANQHIRELAATVQLNYKEFIQPLFLDESITEQTPIALVNFYYFQYLQKKVSKILILVLQSAALKK
jgi:delta-aminolevulinic acid dehydratase/porphobilinogen synthase